MTSTKHPKIIALWLFICCATIYSMVVLGGATRLTGSGLSMVQWEPIMGSLPPMTESQWLEKFEQYKQFPEFKVKNPTMDLDAFKSIFWFEYSHRLLGRLIGIIFFFPMVFFFYKGWVSSSLKPRLIAMFILGGLQGLLGWYMVKSGLVNNPDVSQYRLAAHLGLALFVYAYILWLGMDLFFEQDEVHNQTSTINNDLKKKRLMNKLKPFSLFLSFFVFITAISGGFVAGLKAGYAYNTFPLMNGQLIPDGLFTLEPGWINFFENITTVQFDHRLLVSLLFISLIVFYCIAIRKKPPRSISVGLHLMLVILFIQVSLGISTLLLHVPVLLAVGHQAGALLLFTIMLYLGNQIKRI